jgi:hypothetical protein
MSPELEQKLVEKYPKIFNTGAVDAHLPFPMFGIECDDGWYDLLDTLCGQIQWYLDHNADEDTEQVTVAQIKEKFGTLRFYENGGDLYIAAYIQMAQSMSALICEVCGNRGVLRGGGWIKTLCDVHADGREDLRSELSRLP